MIGGDGGGGDVYKERAEPVLVSLSDLYSEMKKSLYVSRSMKMDLIFIFISYFYFSLPFLFFSFFIFRTTRVRGYQSHCHISHNLMA